jgi:hypothetical protein
LSDKAGGFGLEAACQKLSSAVRELKRFLDRGEDDDE